MAAAEKEVPQPMFFATPVEFRAWLAEHHLTERELLVGYHKVGSGRPSITWPESVDEALCVGWIDGVRRRIDDDSYSIRFTPRKPGSIWSAVNVARVAELMREGRMLPAGLKAFEARKEAKTSVYAYEQRDEAALSAGDEQQFRANEAAWHYFQSQPASYRRAAIWWVVSARRAETRQKRLAQLIDDSAHGRTVPPLTRR